MSILYNRIQELCKGQGINVTQPCAESGAPRGSLTDLKMDRISTLSTATLTKIANRLGVTTDCLLGSETKKEPATQTGSGLQGTGYDLLNEKNKAIVDALIETLLASQSDS